MFGRILIALNREAKHSASTTYNAICVYNEFGEYETLLMTESDLSRLRSRAAKNQEDSVRLSVPGRVYLWVGRLLRLI
jgi:hypothetical protein